MSTSKLIPLKPLIKELPLLLRIPEVAEILSISRTSAYEMVAAGLLPSVRVGRNKGGIRVPRLQLEGWIEKNSHELSVA